MTSLYPHQLTLGEDSIYRCACGATGTWDAIRPHVYGVAWHRDDGLGERSPIQPRAGEPGYGNPHPGSLREPYDEDAAQDSIAGRPHWGSSLAFIAALEPEPTCQSCGHTRDDHQLRGHPFVIWFKS